MIHSKSRLEFFLISGLLILAGCVHHIKYERGTISGESKIAIFSWRGSVVSSRGLKSPEANTILKKLNSIASEDFVKRDMLKGISKVIPGNHFIIQPSDYISDSKGKVDIEATCKKIGADIVLEMSTIEIVKQTPYSKTNKNITYWESNLKVEAKMWRVSNKKVLWQKTCLVNSEKVFGIDAFRDCSKLAVKCLIYDISKP